MIEAVGVVIPARDEQALLPDCLASVRRAANALPIDVTVAIVVAQDSCADATSAVIDDQVRVDARVTTIAGAWRSAGSARRAAAEEACHRLRHTVAGRTWLASTDADSVVTPTWLEQQVAHADEGWDAVAGIVDLAPDDPLRPRFLESYPLARDHPHTYVHGANLGIRASTYLKVGGWPARVDVGEDQWLWDTVRIHGFAALATTGLVVRTSSRRTSRVQDGFAARLRELTDQAEPVPQPGGSA